MSHVLGYLTKLVLVTCLTFLSPASKSAKNERRQEKHDDDDDDDERRATAHTRSIDTE